MKDMSSAANKMPPHQTAGYSNSGYSAAGPDVDPELEQIIERLHIGTLQREKLRARRSILVDDEVPPLTQYEAEVLSQSETYSVTSEESYNDSAKRHKRKTSGTSSRDSGLGKDSSPQFVPRSRSPRPPSTSKDQEVQTTLKGYKYNKLQDVSDAEEGKLGHRKLADEKHKGSKLPSLFKGKKQTHDDNHNLAPGAEIGLPQTFIVKYMGKKPAKGYGGAKYTQTPVEEIIEAVNQLPKGSDLPLVKLEVTLDGLNMTPHKRNKVKSFESVSIPIQFISYGAQDQNYPRVFCFIMVREMSARSKKLDCHVYACDSSKSARKLAGLLALAFGLYQEQNEGKPSTFGSSLKQPSIDDDTKSSYDV